MPDPTAQLLAVHEIEQVLYRYAAAIDSHAFDLLETCFAERASVELAGLPRMDRAGYLELCRKTLPGFDATQHCVSNPSVRVAGERADARCYFVAQHVKNALRPDPCLIIGGWYDDRLVRGVEGWRIEARTGTALWFDGNPEVLGYPMPPGAFPRSPAHAAPAWLRAAR